MLHLGNASPGQFCWVDLAAADADAAKAFYGECSAGLERAARTAAASRGCAIRSGRRFGLSTERRHLENGVPSHWTPYLRVDDVDVVVQRAVALGGEVIVPPFVVEDTARIALILDCVGAQVGLWEPIGSGRGENTHG